MFLFLTPSLRLPWVCPEEHANVQKVMLSRADCLILAQGSAAGQQVDSGHCVLPVCYRWLCGSNSDSMLSLHQSSCSNPYACNDRLMHHIQQVFLYHLSCMGRGSQLCPNPMQWFMGHSSVLPCVTKCHVYSFSGSIVCCCRADARREAAHSSAASSHAGST